MGSSVLLGGPRAAASSVPAPVRCGWCGDRAAEQLRQRLL